MTLLENNLVWNKRKKFPKKFARALLIGKAIPGKYPEDALHISVAAVNGIDVIVT